MDRQILQQQNIDFSGTNGVSMANKDLNFMPAFLDEVTGKVEITRFHNGDPAPMHLICGLPEEWAIEHDEGGDICRVKDSIIAGFLLGNTFYTREEAANYSEC